MEPSPPDRSSRPPDPFGTWTLRNPWNLVVAGLGAGTAWAIGLPVVAAGVVGGGMYGVAAVIGVLRDRRNDRDSSEPAPRPLRAGTAQAHLVNTLHDYRINLDLLERTRLQQAVAVTAAQATEAARRAEIVADRLARALDAIDDAITRADHVARHVVRQTQVQESVQRMKQQRRDLLAGLTRAVDEIGEVYAKLLELSTTTGLLGPQTGEISEAGQVSQSLDLIRGVFADLDALHLSAASVATIDEV